MAGSAGHNYSSRRRGKSEAAFRTISEVASDLDLPQHVLRFWETKFVQVRPMKRGGGRRYYRPEDVVLLRRIRDLLYEDGYTIKGVQKLLKQNGGKPAASIPVDLPDTGPGISPVATRGAMPEAQPAEDSPPSGMSVAQRRELSVLLDELQELRDLLKRGR